MDGSGADEGPTSAEDAMTTTRKNTSKTFTLIGAGVGLATYLAVGLLPSILYGGYAGLLLAGGIFGTPVDASFPVRALIVAGMVVGVAALASLFAVLGAVVGAAVAALTRSGKVEPGAGTDPAVEHKP
jgi:hypothetical protein